MGMGWRRIHRLLYKEREKWAMLESIAATMEIDVIVATKENGTIFATVGTEVIVDSQ
jgi:hypothetical protein